MSENNDVQDEPASQQVYMTKEKNYSPFSVLMSVYMKEKPKYLDEALTSIENQTVVPSEIVLVEDGPLSTELQKVIDIHRRKFTNTFKVIKAIYNQGLGQSLRLGTQFVSTDWIARMDSDDISVPDRFEIQLKEINKHPELALIGGQVQEFANSTLNIVGYRRVPTSESLLRQFIKWRSPFNHPTVMIKKKALQQVGGYVSYGNLEDYYLWARIIVNNYHIANVDQVLVKMRVDEGMYQRRGGISNIKYFYRLRSFLFEHGLSSRREKILANIIMTINILIPGIIRKFIYQHVMHRLNSKKKRESF